MCVIVHKESGIDLPSEEILQKCFNKNPHGAGILLHRMNTKTLEIHKGFMKFDEFKKAFSDLKIQKEDDAFFHFRITTSGGTSPENCHPFPISNKVEDLTATRINTTRAFIHNGVLGDGDKDRKLSDTQLFVEQVMSLQEIQDNLDDEEVDKLITEMSKSNRFVVADAEKGIFKRYGNWYEDNGLFFSNESWKSTYKYQSKNKYNYDNNWYSDFYYNEKDYNSHEFYSNIPNELPNINSIECPYCDKKMELMDKHYPYYMCPSCALLYNDDTFELYEPGNKYWMSIVDLNDLQLDYINKV